MRRHHRWGIALLAGLAGLAAAAAKDVLVVVDGAGKEHKLQDWKFVAGTRPLSWLADNPKAEALAFREENSTNYVDGILTLVPLERIQAIAYDAEKQTVTVTVATADKDAPIELVGNTKFAEGKDAINRLALEAEADLGDLGVAEVKFVGGPKTGIRRLTFPTPKAGPAANGRPATVTAREKDPTKAPHAVTDLQAVYRLPDGSSRLLPVLHFRKTLKIDLAKLQKLQIAPVGTPDARECQVTLSDGAEHTLSLLLSVDLDGQKANLEGLLGRVPAGYKQFPLHAVADIEFGAAKP